MKKETKNLGLLALLMASITLAGCNDSGGSGSGGSGGGGSGGGGSDNGGSSGGNSTSGLAVTETIPADGAIGVDIQPTITAIFNADVGGSEQDDKIDLFLHSTQISTDKSTLGAPADRVTLTPTDALERGTTYTVRIAGDFEDDSFRTLGTAFEWTFSTVDKTFGDVVIVNEGVAGHTSESGQLENDEGGRSPVVAIDGNGNLMAVWVDKKSSTAFDVWSRYYDADRDSWLAPHRLLESGTSENSSSVGPYTPAVGMDGDGNTIVVTHDREGNNHRMLAYHFDAGTQTWAAGGPVVIGLEEDVEEAFNGDNVDFQSPSLYVAESGRALVAWTQHRTSSNLTGLHTIWATTYDGSDWATATAMGETGKLAVLPSVALDEQGNGMVIWNQETGTFDYYSTYARGVDSDGNWGAATVRLEDRSDTGRRNQTRLIALGDGEFLAIWRPKEIRASHFDGATWTDAETIGTVFIDTGFGPIFDAVKTSNGDVLVAWQHHRNGQIATTSEFIPRNVHEYAIWSNGNWSAAEPLANTDNVTRDVSQDVTLAALDNGMVLMARFGVLSGASDDRVFVQSFQDGTWSPFATVPGCFGDRAKKPMLATAGNEAVLLTTHGDVCAYFYE